MLPQTDPIRTRREARAHTSQIGREYLCREHPANGPKAKRENDTC